MYNLNNLGRGYQRIMCPVFQISPEKFNSLPANVFSNDKLCKQFELLIKTMFSYTERQLCLTLNAIITSLK